MGLAFEEEVDRPGPVGSFTVGLDLGQATDYSALVVVERVLPLPAGYGGWTGDRRAVWLAERGRPPVELQVRHAQRWQLGTPYPAVVADTSALMASMKGAGMLFFDATGVGRAIKDLLTEAYLAGDMGPHWPLPVTTVASTAKGSGRNVPKRDLMAAVQVPLQQGRLKIARGLPLGDQLERELTSYRQKLSASGRDTFDIARTKDGGHGDLVSALCLACKFENFARRPRAVETPAVEVAADQ